VGALEPIEEKRWGTKEHSASGPEGESARTGVLSGLFELVEKVARQRGEEKREHVDHIVCCINSDPIA
jgi:hypothetical protein